MMENLSPGEARGGLLVVGAVALLALLPLLPPWAGLVAGGLVALILALASLRRALPALHASLAILLLALALMVAGWLLWPLPLLLALAAYGLAVRLVPALRLSTAWLRRGRLDAPVLAWIGAIIVISSSALLLWYLALQPNLADIKALIPPHLPLWALPLVALAFSSLNALAEEFLYRGVIQEALMAVARPAVAIALQAVAFGAAHIHGFPRGMMGVLLATIYGLMLGALRHRSQGMLAPWAAHVFADITIVLILALLV